MIRAALCTLLALGGCAGPDACQPPGYPALVAQLLFGLSTRGGGAVTPAQFDRFVATEIAPRFPDGMTVLAGDGRYTPPGGEIQAEPSRMVVLVTRNGAGTRARLAAIRDAYRGRFDQQSVGLITSRACAAF